MTPDPGLAVALALLVCPFFALFVAVLVSRKERIPSRRHGRLRPVPPPAPSQPPRSA